jgi:hypothetical protein
MWAAIEPPRRRRARIGAEPGGPPSRSTPPRQKKRAAGAALAEGGLGTECRLFLARDLFVGLFPRRTPPYTTLRPAGYSKGRWSPSSPRLPAFGPAEAGSPIRDAVPRGGALLGPPAKPPGDRFLLPQILHLIEPDVVHGVFRESAFSTARRIVRGGLPSGGRGNKVRSIWAGPPAGESDGVPLEGERCFEESGKSALFLAGQIRPGVRMALEGNQILLSPDFRTVEGRRGSGSGGAHDESQRHSNDEWGT